MKRIFLAFALLILFACGPIQDQAESTVSMGSPDGFAVSCATAFTRTAPHICKKNSTSSVSLILDNTCRSVDHLSTWGVPASSRYVFGAVLGILVSNNVVTDRRVQVTVYNESTCTTIHDTVDISVREFVAVPATIIQRSYSSLQVPLTNNGNMYFKANNLDGASHSVLWELSGYYD